MDRKELEKVMPAHKKALLGSLFKLSSVDGKSVEDPRNFSRVPGVITCVRLKI